jgi:hypothetical protein
MKNLGRARYAQFPPEASLHFHLDDPLPGSPATGPRRWVVWARGADGQVYRE